MTVVADEERELNFALHRASPVTGRVVDAQTGEPLPGAWLSFGGGWETRPDLNGRFDFGPILGHADHYLRVEALYPQPYNGQFWEGVECPVRCGDKPPSFATPIRGRDGEPLEFEFRLRRPLVTHTFRFVDFATRAPLAGIGIVLYSGTGYHALTSTTVSDASGTLTVSVPAATYFAKSWNASGLVDGLPGDVVCGLSCNLATGAYIDATKVTSTTIALHRIGISDVIPGSGSIVGGDVVTINGGGFKPGAAVTVGGIPAQIIESGSTAIRVRVPSGAVGPAEVRVANGDGTAATKSDGYRYYATCATLSVTPSRGSGSLGGAILRLGIASSATPSIMWFRGTRGDKPFVRLFGSDSTLTVPALDEAKYSARVSVPCHDVELALPDHPGSKRRAMSP